MKVYKFERHGNHNYVCDQPGDNSGEYYKKEDVDYFLHNARYDIDQCEDEIARLKDNTRVFTKGINAVRDLIHHSDGVTGLHLNGDDAPWDSLLAGGRFEEWLNDLSDAMELIDE